MPEPPAAASVTSGSGPTPGLGLSGRWQACWGRGVVSLGAFGALIIWHLVRRGRLLREGLGRPRVVRLAGVRADGAGIEAERVLMTMTAATFRPHERINDPEDFRRAFDRKRSASDDKIIVYGVENGRDHARLGISLSRKKVRRAHDRNRVKRLLREAFRLSKAELPAGVDLVVVPRGPRLTFADARGAFPRLAQAVARRLGIRVPKAPPP